MSEDLDSVRKERKIHKAILAFFATVATIYGADKGIDLIKEIFNPEQARLDRMTPEQRFEEHLDECRKYLQVEDSAAIPETLEFDRDQFGVRVVEWSERGAWDDRRKVEFPNTWMFPHGDKHLPSVILYSNGSIAESPTNRGRIAALPTRVSIVPGEGEMRHGLTPDNSYLFKWGNVRPNRAETNTVDMGIELHRNGDITVNCGNITNTTPRVLPYPHNGYGQDDEWVRANFTRLQALSPSLTNAEEILSVGYKNWVDQQVGSGFENGLYKFTASFQSKPAEALRFAIGEYNIVVTNAGDYVFLLEKGRGYEFWSDSEEDIVEYRIEDDVPIGRAKLIQSVKTASISLAKSECSVNSSAKSSGGKVPGEEPPPGVWSVDGGWYRIDYPDPPNHGSVIWMPTLTAGPDLIHLFPDDIPKQFYVIVSDCRNVDDLKFNWGCYNCEGDYLENASFTPNNTRETMFDAQSVPNWKQLEMSVSTEINGYYLRSYVKSHYGTNENPQVGFTMTAPEVVFLNDDDRTSRWYRVRLAVSCPVATNVVVSVVPGGATLPRFASDACGENPFSLTNICLTTSLGQDESTYDFYFACGKVGSDSFTATATLESGEVRTITRSFRVIEPLRKLITTVKNDMGDRYVNPSRLVYGETAYLEVDKNGPFSAQDIKWHIVEGPGALTNINGCRAQVMATAPSGTVVVEAAFGTDEQIQPRFVLPIVQKKRIPIKVYYVLDKKDNKPKCVTAFEEYLETANVIFAQVGVELFLTGSPQSIADASYSILKEHDKETDRFGRQVLGHACSRQANELSSFLVEDNSLVHVVYVHSIIQGTEIGFYMPDSHMIVMGAKGSNIALAHEIGHAMGLEDIYSRRKYNQKQLMPEWGAPPFQKMFHNPHADWGSSQGRGFYSHEDVQGVLIDGLLMNGFDCEEKCDIPDDGVRGYSENPKNSFDLQMRKVGASTIRKEGK